MLLVYYRVNLYDFADILISKGVVNAINLDGGGSATFLVDGVLANHPSDVWLVSVLCVFVYSVFVTGFVK